MFYETIKPCIEYFKINGKVNKIDRFDLAAIQISFEFFYKYLTIFDHIYYEVFDVNKKTILENTVKHIKEISYQFRFYFEGIWG